jgi:hypothetical protein
MEEENRKLRDENERLKEENRILRQDMKKILDSDIAGVVTAVYGFEEAKKIYIRNRGVFVFYGRKYYS